MEMKASIALHKKFIKGLAEYNLTEEEVKKNWKYCGGDRGRHYNYFKLSCPNDDEPEHTNECVCKHYIEENCYITNGEEILVLGNCCIKKFLPKSGRTCELCDEPHKNRIVNRCNDCRFGICDKCNKKCNSNYKLCFDCKFDHPWFN